MTKQYAFSPPRATWTNATPLPGAELDWQDWLRQAAPSLTGEFAEHHLRAWEWFEGLGDVRVPGGEIPPPALVECWARGHGKSTTLELAIARLAVRAQRRFALYVSCDQDAANRHVQAIGTAMERVGIERAVNKYGASRGWSANLLRTANGFSVLGFGLDAGARGVKLDEFRPDVILLDDVDELNDSVDAVEKKIRTITQTVLPCGAPGAAVGFFQNMIHTHAVMAQTMSGEADLLRRRVYSIPVPAVEGLRTEEVPPVEEGGLPTTRITAGTATWAGKPLPVCEAEINTLGLVSFLRECQHEVGTGGLLFPRFSPQKEGREWHVCKSFPIPEHWAVWGSHDYGTGAPCSGHLYAADEYGDVYVVGEIYGAGWESSKQAQNTLEMYHRFGAAYPIDPKNRDGQWHTRANLIAFDHANTFPPDKPSERVGEYPVEVWWRRGLPCVKAVKDRIAGWRTWQEWLAATRLVDGQMKPRYQIFENECPRLVTALQTAMTNPRDPEDLDPGFKNDHPLDDGRYGIMVRPSPSGLSPEARAEAKREARDNPRYRDDLMGDDNKRTL